MLRKKSCVGLVVLLFCSAFVQAESITLKGADAIYDCFLDNTYNYKYVDLEYFRVREYWACSDYDFRTFIRVDLSSLPADADIESAKLFLNVHPATVNTDPMTVDLWKISPFTEDLTGATCDGVNPWPGGPFDGIDGYYRTPAENLLASAPITADMVGSYMEFSGSALTDYVQSQSDLSAGRYAYLEISWVDDSCNLLATWYSTEADASLQPYMAVTLVPEPATLGLLGMGVLTLLRKKK